MLGLLTRRPRTDSLSAAPRRAIPWLEQLETRDCPAAPVLTLNAAVLPNHLVELTGTVTDESPTTVLINFSGVMGGTTHADGTGHFDYVAQAAALGNVFAVGVDNQNLFSNTAFSPVSTPAPSVTLNLSYGQQRTVTLSGHISGIDVGGLSVGISGVAQGTVLTAADGTFTWTTQASALGTIRASTTDFWGQTSNQAQVAVSVAAPTITNFQATEDSYGLWTFSGKVNCASPQGLTVVLFGIPSLNNVQVTVNSDGTFIYCVKLAVGEDGIVNAKTTDWWGQDSNVAQYLV